MNKLKRNWRNLVLVGISFFFFISISTQIYSANIKFEIQGNNFTDTNVILSLIENIPDNLSEENSNDIIKTLYESNLFADVRVKLTDTKYIIIVKEFPTINKLYFNNNERLDDEDLKLIAKEINLINYNIQSINLFINTSIK